MQMRAACVAKIFVECEILRSNILNIEYLSDFIFEKIPTMNMPFSKTTTKIK